MTNFAKIRAALNSYERIVRHTEQLGVSQQERRATVDEALAALAELERAAAQPVAWMWEFKHLGRWVVEFRTIERPADTVDRRSITPLYAAPPAPVAEIREPVEVDDEIARKLWREWFDAGCMTGLDTARFWLRVWQRELGPTLGMVEIREPSDDECADIHQEWLNAHGIQGYGAVQNGRAMFNSVRAVMWPKSEAK